VLVTKPVLATCVDEGLPLPFEITLPPLATIGAAHTLFLLMGSVTVTAAEFMQTNWYWLVML
jgi:hypothetical protein